MSISIYERCALKKIIFYCCLLFATSLESFDNLNYSQFQTIKVCPDKSEYCRDLIELFDEFGVVYDIVETIIPDDKNLYVIFNICEIDQTSLPKYYIAAQSADLTNNKYYSNCLDKLKNAIVVWDYSNDNIKNYSNLTHNYFYFPKKYEYADPILLVCFLPLEALFDYRDLVVYSNKKNSDISSHLPTIFCYCLMANPQFMVEAGVRNGESTIPLSRALKLINAMLVGIDISSSSEKVYTNIKNAKFVCMDDLNFINFYNNSPFKNKEIDLIFIDTSHLYRHTLKEIEIFKPLLSTKGIMIFHDSFVTPINGTHYSRLNGTIGGGWGGNTNGVTVAIKEYFSIAFDESKYTNITFVHNNNLWQLIHYPFCNGLAILKKIGLK